MTLFADFYDDLRTILGDRQVAGVGWHYAEADLKSALRSVFMLGRGPVGYALDAARGASTGVTPDVAAGDAYALIVYDAALLLVGGEDGKLSYVTRSMSVNDGGDRKRDLLWELKDLLHEVRNGTAYFTSSQTFSQYLGTMRQAIESGQPVNGDHVSLTVNSGVRDLTV